ncbi:hypothetical protein NSK_008598 [Nannochloropsis salina CCMP1776]|uniref:Uncharacterized protein n=1 Tax=Nannochloropsis salina CCMP1776 TaxID=1027361 RepID=A0A4D9CLQ7_9STRA|nr:hypothetical protein NSK_008598 [Nannochloropsis salina CCMP1776]|eukprot:TFJ80040.1 hypothetical protein NSK_008598 [Nannochloropsis salina CCMP1776]
MQENEAKTSITDLKELLTCDTRLADRSSSSHPEYADQKGTEGGQVKANDDCEIVARTLGDGRNKLARLLQECTQWEARRLASELPLRLLRRFNGWMEREIRKLTATLEEVQAEKSRLVHSNLRNKAPARLVSMHEAVLTLKRMLDKQRGIKARVLEQLAGKQTRLETLRQKAQALDARLRAEEAIYMEMRAPKSLSPDVVRGSRLPAPDPSLPASPPAGPVAAMTTPVVITSAVSCPTPAEKWECPNPHGTRPIDDTEGTKKRKRMRGEVQHPASRTEEASDMQ